jgi:hypothetical protein
LVVKQINLEFKTLVPMLFKSTMHNGRLPAADGRRSTADC